VETHSPPNLSTPSSSSDVGKEPGGGPFQIRLRPEGAQGSTFSFLAAVCRPGLFKLGLDAR
jgi:hypothetical protein